MDAGELVEMGEWSGELVRGGWPWAEKWKDDELAAAEDEPDIQEDQVGLAGEEEGGESRGCRGTRSVTRFTRRKCCVEGMSPGS